MLPDTRDTPDFFVNVDYRVPVSYSATTKSETIKLYNTIQYKNDFYSVVIEGAEALVGRL